MKIVNVSTMQKLDKLAIEEAHIPSLQLMENAGQGIFDVLQENFDEIDFENTIIICGKGNNGGDGLVVARLLYNADYTPMVYLVGNPDDLQGDAHINFNRYLALGQKVHFITSESDVILLENELNNATLIIDALLGTGTKGTIKDLFSKIIEAINKSDATIVAIDIPSGISGDTGENLGQAVDADYTVTMALPKYGHLFQPGKEHSGELHIVDIGIPETIIEQHSGNVQSLSRDEAVDMLPKRSPAGHKGTFGKLLIVAGSAGFTGAAALTARAAYRSGVGLVYPATPEGIADILVPMTPEAVLIPLPEVNKHRCLALRSLGRIMEMVDAVDAIAIGPGIGTYPETKELLSRLIARIEKPMVIDADALNCLAKTQTESLDWLKTNHIITPHPGEMKRLLNQPISSNPLELLNLLSQLTSKNAGTIVLKGAPTIIGTSSNKLYINPTGNDGMATGGSGDVLTGIVGSLLAQGIKIEEAAVLGNYLHGLSGDIAADSIGRRSLIASDIIGYLPQAFLRLTE